MGKDGKRGEDRKAKKERKEREKEEKRLSRQRAPSVGSDQGGFDLDPSLHPSPMVPPLSLVGSSNAAGGADGNDSTAQLDSTKSPTSFLLDQMTTMLALMNGHHQHEVDRLSLDGLLDTLTRIEDNDPRVTAFDGQDYRHCFTTELYERLFLALEKNRWLATLRLTHLDLEDGHLEFLAESLQINNSIMLLDLSWNHFTNEGVLRLLEALEGSLGNKSLQDVHLFGNSEPIHPKIAREINKYLRRNKNAKAKRGGRSGTVYVPMPVMGSSAAAAVPGTLSGPTVLMSSQPSPGSASPSSSNSPYSSSSALSLNASGGAMHGGGSGGSGGSGANKDRRSSAPVSEKEKERLRRLEDELNVMTREMKENKREKKALKELNELLKQKITDLVTTSSTSTTAVAVASFPTPPASPSTTGSSFPPFAPVSASEEAKRRSKEVEREEKAHRKAEKAAQKRAKRGSASQQPGTPQAPGGGGAGAPSKKSPRGVKNFFSALGSSDATISTQKGRERAHSLTFEEPPVPARPVGSPSQTIVNPLSSDRSLGASHLYGMASVSALGSLVSARAGGGGNSAGGIPGVVKKTSESGTKKKAVIGRCIKQVNIGVATPAIHVTTERGEEETEMENVYCNAYECLLDGWGCHMRELTLPISLLSNTIHSISSPPTSPTPKSNEARRAAVRLTKRGLDVSINPLDELEKEIIKLEQLPVHDNLARYLHHERCGPHFDTLRVYITRHGAFLPQEETSLAHFLRERRRRRDLLSEWEVIQVANQIHAAIHFLHSHSIIHRDLRLDNVHLWGAPSNGLVVVGGFDSMDSVAASAYEIKTGASDAILRAPQFMAPELMSSAPTAPLAFTTQTDVWAFGMILYSLLTLRVPYDSMNATQVKEAVLAGQRPELKSKDQLEADNVSETSASSSQLSLSSTSPVKEKSPRRARSPRKKRQAKEGQAGGDADEAKTGERAMEEENEAEQKEKAAKEEKRKSDRTKALMRYAKLQDLVRNMTAQDPAKRPTLDKVKLYLFLCESM